MLTRLLAVLCSLALVIAVAGCSKDDAKKSDKDNAKKEKKQPKVEKEPEAPKAPPTAEEVAKIDCAKTCDTQMECYKKGGAIKPTEQMKKGCLTGCKMLTTKGIYKPKVHGPTARGMLKYAAGKCK